MDDLTELPTHVEESEKASKEWTKINLAAGKREQFSKYRKFGLCWNCVRMVYIQTKYGKQTCVCRNYDQPDRKLDAADPVVECSDHADKFAMSLSMMIGMAKLIDVEGPKQAGFIVEKEKNK